MLCLRSVLCGLLTSCLCSLDFGGCLGVIQSPSTFTLREGVQEVRIICSWNISTARPLKVRWFKDNHKVEVNQTGTKFWEFRTSSCSVLKLNGADGADAGLYRCEVTQDVPQLRTVNGTGTKVTQDTKTDSVTVSTRPGSSASPQDAERTSGAAVWASASAAAVLLFICVCLSVWRMKRRNTQSERTVIREGPPSEEEERENSEDGGSLRTSRGSTQWYMVPVYESYFDLQRSDDKQCAETPPPPPHERQL